MSQESLTRRLQETLAVFEQGGEPRTTTEVAGELDLGRRATYARLERLVDEGELRTKKVGANARVWWYPGVAGVGNQQDSAGETEGFERREQQFQSLVEATDEYAIFMLDTDGYVQTWNPGARRIKGYDSHEILDRHFSTFYTEADRADGVPEQNLKAAARVGSIEDEGWRLCRDGSRFWANVTITAIRNDDGDLVGYAKVTRDMTERRERERQLREEKAFVESLLDTQPDILYAYDLDGNFLRWNDRLREVTGYTDAEIAELEPLDFVHERAVDELAAAMEQVIEHGDRLTIELPLVTADGEEIPYEFTGGPLTDEDGSIIGVTGIGRDISDRKAREHRLERQRDELETQLEETFERIDDAFLSLDDEFRFEYVNESAANFFERPESELLGRSVWDVLDVDDDPIVDRFETAMATQEPTSFERFSEPLGIWVYLSVYPSPTGLSVYFRDITERKERERKLELQERRFETLVDHFPNGAVALVDQDLRYTTFGGVPEGETDLTRHDLEGEPLRDTLPPELADAVIPGYEAALAGESTSFEEPIDDRVYQFHFVPVRDEHGEVFLAIGMSQDITERTERERELQQRIRQQKVVTDLGTRALEDVDLDTLMAEASECVADTLGNDYCKVLDLDPDAENLLLRQGVGWDEGMVGSATVSATENDSQAAYTLAVDEPVIVSDLDTESRFSGPDLLTDHDVRSGISTIIGPFEAPWGILGTHDTDPKEFSSHDVNFVQSVANILSSAITRKQAEEKLLHQREQLAALNNLNHAVREITDAVIDQSTRDEIEATVCERLAASDSYEFAWIGEVDVTSQTVSVRQEAGAEGYLDDVVISTDPEDERSQGPTGQAFLTGETQTTRDTYEADSHEPWRDHVEEYGFRSSVAIPLKHDGTIYGTLNVYAERPGAFEGQELAVIEQLGDVVGHAIAATERKQTLLSDTVVELEFFIPGIFDELGVDERTDGTVTVDNVVSVSADDFLVYGTATPDAIDSLHAIRDALPHWESVTIREGDGDSRFELRLSESPVLSTVASVGGEVKGAILEDGDYRLTVHASPTVDVRRIIEIVEEAYPAIQLRRRRQVTRERDGPAQGQLLTDALTERQRTTLETAFHAGFFEWPRDVSGEDVANSLDIAPSTFHQHLRKAERRVFEQLLASTVPVSA